MNDLVVGEIPHQPSLNVGVAGNAAKDLGALEGCLWVGATMVQITARGEGTTHPRVIITCHLIFTATTGSLYTSYTSVAEGIAPPGYVDDVVGPARLRADPLEELLQRGDQQRRLALAQQVHEHHLLLQCQLQQAQAVEHRRLQVLLACGVEEGYKSYA